LLISFLLQSARIRQFYDNTMLIINCSTQVKSTQQTYTLQQLKIHNNMPYGLFFYENTHTNIHTYTEYD